MECRYNCCKNELSGKQRKFCSPGCKLKQNVHDSRRRGKKRAVEYLGGKCVNCGYDKCYGALQFHHGNDDKETLVSRLISNNRPWAVVLVELKKCTLLCANCHAEKHYL